MSRVKGRDFTKQAADMLIEQNQEVHLSSRLGFLKEHRGIRKGKIHLFVGVSGGGKSTLTRTLLLDVTAALKKGKKVGVWLSEETSDELLTQMSFSGIAHNAQVLMDRIEIYSEQDDENLEKSTEQHFHELKSFLDDRTIDVLFYDNLTTSNLYADMRPETQKNVLKKIKSYAQKTETAMILIAHSGADAKTNGTRILEGNDIRGSKQPVNLAEYVYILQSFSVSDRKITTLRIEKSRGHTIRHNFFQLRYDSAMRTYIDGRALNFSEFKEIFKNRDKL